MATFPSFFININPSPIALIMALRTSLFLAASNSLAVMRVIIVRVKYCVKTTVAAKAVKAPNTYTRFCQNESTEDNRRGWCFSQNHSFISPIAIRPNNEIADMPTLNDSVLGRIIVAMITWNT